MSSHPYMTDHYEEEKKKALQQDRLEKLEQMERAIEHHKIMLSKKGEHDSSVEELFYAFSNREKIYNNRKLINLLGEIS